METFQLAKTALITAILLTLNPTEGLSTGAVSLVNRGILSVEKNAYSLFDVEILLTLWNEATPDARIKNTTDWRTSSGFSDDKNKGFLKNYEKLPPDARRLLFIAINWPEIERLGLFIPLRSELNSLLAIARKPETWTQVTTETKKYISNIPEDQLTKYVEIVLRSKTCLKVRGELKENAGNTQWVWHKQP